MDSRDTGKEDQKKPAEGRRGDRSARSLRDAIERYTREESRRGASSGVPEWVMPTEPDGDESSDGSSQGGSTDTSAFLESLFETIDPDLGDEIEIDEDDDDDNDDNDGGWT